MVISGYIERVQGQPGLHVTLPQKYTKKILQETYTEGVFVALVITMTETKTAPSPPQTTS